MLGILHGKSEQDENLFLLTLCFVFSYSSQLPILSYHCRILVSRAADLLLILLYSISRTTFSFACCLLHLHACCCTSLHLLGICICTPSVFARQLSALLHCFAQTAVSPRRQSSSHRKSNVSLHLSRSALTSSIRFFSSGAVLHLFQIGV
ncbi:hypothetical protein RchiOBHm_Chr3g0468381 [Rosa chinensis]|uniref:Uncharacterized protein n=1 Tax=Rosa chinensis TaxID=74649 RepID=A0A2P6RAG9_ROSCH|nr:hypothetical protein RchiOBHm_Chr3g0468381 [Rosa chinensis]